MAVLSLKARAAASRQGRGRLVSATALTDAELRATPVAVSASALPLPTGAATETTLAAASASLTSIDGKLASPMPVTGPLTDAQLRATAVPVSGPLTDAQLRATAVAISAAALPLPTGAATETTLLSVDARASTKPYLSLHQTSRHLQYSSRHFGLVKALTLRRL